MIDNERIYRVTFAIIVVILWSSVPCYDIIIIGFYTLEASKE